MKAFLKFHRTDPAAVNCLRFWLEVFKEHETYILCDHYDPTKDETPYYLKSSLLDYSVTVINSDYSIGREYCMNLKGAKRNMASANMTGFNHVSKKQKGFWIIDADDTLFLTRNFNLVRDKIRLAEQYFIENSLDGFSLDFYRNLNDCWTFGVCLLRSTLDWKKIQTPTNEEIRQTGLAQNIDTVFNLLKEKNIFKLKNFVFNKLAFQHQENNYPEMPHGIYVWSGNTLWNTSLRDDVIVL